MIGQNRERRFRAEIDRLWRENHRALKARARSLSQGRSDRAEELLSEAVIRLLEYALRSQREIVNLKALAFLAIRHAAYDRGRRESHQANIREALQSSVDSAPSYHENSEDSLGRRETLRRIVRVVESRDTVTRQVFYGRMASEQSYSEIATELGISEALARKRVQILRQQLRHVLEDSLSSESSRRGIRSVVNGEKSLGDEK